MNSYNKKFRRSQRRLEICSECVRNTENEHYFWFWEQQDNEHPSAEMTSHYGFEDEESLPGRKLGKRPLWGFLFSEI